MGATVLAMPAPPRVRFGPGQAAEELADMIAGGRTLLLHARWSSPSGAAAYGMAASNLRTAIRCAAGDGVDVGAVVPEDERSLAALLRTGGQTFTTWQADGSKLTHRHLVLDRSDLGVVVMLSVGTGTKLDEQLNQPAVDWLCQQLAVLRPALLYTADVTRMGRNAGDKLTAAMQLVADRCGLFFGDSRTRIQPYTRALGNQLKMQILAAAMEADSLTDRTRGGAQTRAESIRVGPDLRWEWPTGAPLPPGLDSAHMAAPGAGALGRTWAFLDSPATRPDDGDIIAGGSQVRGPDGARVDQVALVRWLLAHHGLPGWSDRACAAELSRRRFSTPALRRLRGDATAVWAVDARYPRNVCRAILSRLDFYESGRLALLPPGSEEPVEIAGVFPPDGPWASPEDFVRLREAATMRQARALPRTRSAAGIAVRYNGRSAVLTADHHGDGVRYRIEDTTARRDGRRNGIRDLVTAADVVELVAALLAAAGDGVERAVDPSRQQKRLLVADQVTSTTAQMDRLRDAQRLRLLELDPATRTLQGAALAAVQEAFNDAAAKLATAQEDLDRHQRHLDVLDRKDHAAAGLPVADMLALAAELRDPWSPQVRDLLRTAVLDLRIDDTTVPAPAGRRATWRTMSARLLLLDHDGTTWSSRAAVQQLHGTWPRYVQDLVDAVEGMRRGEHPVVRWGSKWRAAAPHLAAMLHGRRRPFPFPDPSIEPRLLALAMEVCFPPRDRPGRCLEDVVPGGLPVLAGAALDGEQLRRAARRLHEPLALLVRVRDVHCGLDRPREYYLRDNPQVEALYPRAAAAAGTLACSAAAARQAVGRAPQDWRRTADGLRLRPCRCGSLRRALDRRREVDTSVCLDCRRDRSSVLWPRP